MKPNNIINHINHVTTKNQLLNANAVFFSFPSHPCTGGLDLILMPGLGFDKNGNRLGRGKGFYDLYLQRCMSHPKGKPYTIALAFKEQLCEQVPVDDSDIHIDEVLYEDV